MVAWVATTYCPPSYHGDVPETEQLVQPQFLPKYQHLAHQQRKLRCGVGCDGPCEQGCTWESLEVAHAKGFLIHELDIEVDEFQCQLVTGFEWCGQENVESLQCEMIGSSGTKPGTWLDFAVDLCRRGILVG